MALVTLLFCTVFSWSLVHAEVFLSRQPSNGILCPNQTVTFVCNVSSFSLRWSVTLATGSGLPGMMDSVTFLDDSTLDPNLNKVIQINSYTFNAAIVSRSMGTINSTLRVSVKSALNGTRVSCNDGGLTNRELVMEVVVPPASSPLNIKYTVVYHSVHVSVFLQWIWLSGNVSVNIRADMTMEFQNVIVQENMFHVNALNYNTNYEIAIAGSNCAGQGPAARINLTFVNCSTPISASGVSIEPYSNTTEGAVIYYHCSEGFRSDMRIMAVCKSSGRWNPDPELHNCSNPTLAPVVCNIPSPPINGSFTGDTASSQRSVGSTITFQCDAGLFPVGSLTATCTDDGLWMPNPATFLCTVDQPNCSKPDPPTNGEVILANETTAQIVCNEGYSSQMNLMLVCIHSNQWNPDPTTLNCVKSEIGGSSSPVSAIIGGVLAFLVIAAITAGIIILILLLRMKRKGSTRKKGSLVDLELKSTSETLPEYCTTKHPGPRGNKSVNVHNDNLVYAGLDLPSTNKQSASADDPTSYADINFTSMNEPLKDVKGDKNHQDTIDNLLNLDSLLIQLKPEVTSKWDQFAQVIGLSEELMKDLSSCGPDDRMVEMLDYWLRHHPTKPTWKDVAHILKKINLYQLADSLMEVYETGELPVPFDMNEVPEGTLPRNEPPPPLPPKIVDFDDGPDFLPPTDLPPKPPPHRGAGSSMRAPPPVPPAYHDNGGFVLPSSKPPKSNSHRVPPRPPKSVVDADVPARPPKPPVPRT